MRLDLYVSNNFKFLLKLNIFLIVGCMIKIRGSCRCYKNLNMVYGF